MVRWPTIDDNVRGAALRCQQRKRSRGIDRERRTERHDQVRGGGGFFSLPEHVGIEALSETNRSGFQEAATAAQRRLAMGPEEFEVRFGIIPPPTRLAFDEQIRSVKLD